MWRVIYRSSVKKDLRKINKTDRIAIAKKIQALTTNHRPHGAAKLKGSQNLHRIRHGDYRIIYSLESEFVTILIIRVSHRREVYKNL